MFHLGSGRAEASRQERVEEGWGQAAKGKEKRQEETEELRLGGGRQLLTN